MPRFTDAEGREWVVEVNVATLKAARLLAGVDLLKLVDGDGSSAQALASDPVALVDALYAVVKPEADARKVSDVDFGRALRGDALEAATRALLEGLVDFFPKARREMLRKAMIRAEALQELAMQAAEKKLDEMLTAAEAGLSAGEQTPLSGAVPESSASSRGGSPSAS